MRAAPPPQFHGLLSAQPNSSNNAPLPQSRAIIRRTDFIQAASALANATTNPPPTSTKTTKHSRPSVLSRVQRRWARLSDSLRRKNRVAATHTAAAAAALVATAEVPRAERNPAPVTIETRRNELVAAFDRERVLRASANRGPSREDSSLADELAVCSLGGPTSRRLRQVGARDDDDTLLMLPRIASISFSAADDGLVRRVKESTPRVRQLPRVSALMPTRVGGPRASSSGDCSDRQGSDLNEYSSRPGVALCRLPTGMSNLDVEREMEHAVVEIASSDDESDASASRGESRHSRSIDGQSSNGEEEGQSSLSEDDDEYAAGAWVHVESERLPPSFQGEGELAAMTQTPPDQISASPTTPSPTTPSPRSSPAPFPLQHLRAQSDAVAALISPWQRNAMLDAVPFSRRAASSSHATPGDRAAAGEGEGESRQSCFGEAKGRFQTSKDAALFEDDYLSFQGFHGNENRSHHQSMGSLLRSKRISSVTDSPSEDSDEHVAVVAHLDSRRRTSRRGKLPAVLRFNRRSPSIDLNIAKA